MGLFKKKLPLEDCARVMIHSMSESLQKLKESGSGSTFQQDGLEIDMSVLTRESIFLLAVANEYGLVVLLGQEREVLALRQIFIPLVIKHFSKEGHESRFIEMWAERRNQYLSAIAKESAKISESVGGEFIKFCGYNEDTEIAMKAQMMFLGQMKELEALFKKWELKR